MDKSIAQAVDALTEQLGRNEARYEKLQRQNRFLAIILAVVLATGLLLGANVVEQAQAGPLKDLKMDIQNLNSILADMASLLKSVNSPETHRALAYVDDILVETHEFLVDEKSEIATAITEVRTEMRQMNHNMGVMSVDMHRMSNTVTPAMGRMGNIMQWMPMP